MQVCPLLESRTYKKGIIPLSSLAFSTRASRSRSSKVVVVLIVVVVVVLVRVIFAKSIEITTSTSKVLVDGAFCTELESRVEK